MINDISKKIAQKWISKNIISKEDFELYHYGLFVIITSLELMVFTLILGILFKIIIPSLVFFAVFFTIRRFAGGLHAKTELHCQILTLLLLFFSIAVIKYFLSNPNIDYKYFLILYIVSALLLSLCSPADTPQKPLDFRERIKFKKIIGCLSLAFFLINFILMQFKIDFIYVPIVCAFVLETLLVILGRFFNHRLKDI